MDETEHKVWENRLRRVAARRGLRLEKSRRRDELALTYGTYQLVDDATGDLVAYSATSGYGLTLDDIEQALTFARSTTVPPRSTGRRPARGYGLTDGSRCS